MVAKAASALRVESLMSVMGLFRFEAGGDGRGVDLGPLLMMNVQASALGDLAVSLQPAGQGVALGSFGAGLGGGQPARLHP
jgi:hypothetical protein